MKVALIGASGNVGSRILTELLNRGHEVTSIARHPEKLQRHDRLAAKQGDIDDEAGLAPLLAGLDAVISAVRFQSANPQSLIGAVKKAGVKRLLVVGGAGSLEVSPGVQLVDTPDFPAAYKPEALAGRDFLKAGLRRAASQSKRLRKRRWLRNQLKDWLTRATSRRSPSSWLRTPANQFRVRCCP